MNFIRSVFVVLTIWILTGGSAIAKDYGPPYTVTSTNGCSNNYIGQTVGEAAKIWFDQFAHCNGAADPYGYTYKVVLDSTVLPYDHAAYLEVRSSVYPQDVYRTDIISVREWPYNPIKNIGKQCLCAGDPIELGTGNEYRDDEDASLGGLSFHRYYNSHAAAASSHIGAHWRHSFDRSLEYLSDGTTSTATVFRPDGLRVVFTLQNNQWTKDPDVADRLTTQINATGAITGWLYFEASTRYQEAYDANGNLLSITDTNGQVTTLAYSTPATPASVAPSVGLLLTVTDPRGRSLNFTYNAQGNVVSLTQPDGGVLGYAYGANGNLVTVTYPDTKTRQYVYNESTLTGGTNLPNALTGDIDESGSRLTSIGYNAQGQATMSTLPGGVDLTQVVYNSDSTTSVTYPTGAQATLSFVVPNGSVHASTVSAPCGPGCGQPNAAATFDGNGYVASTTDFNGNVTAMTHDANGLLDQQVDSSGSADQRTTNITWDTTLRLPLTRTVLDTSGNTAAKTSWVYNTIGQPLARCDVDPNVSAAASYTCAVAGIPPVGVRRWTYTYCDVVDSTQCPIIGLLLSVDGPRTDVSDVTTFAYDLTDSATSQHGDLKSITDALGHVTTYAAYDGAGRVTRLIDANGVTTDLTYTPRGWLASRSVGGATTALTYTPYGAVASITDPDNVTTTFIYDAAHRLTDVTDALGNRIHYTLDAAGNKTGEQTLASTGAVMRSLSHSYNALGQLTAVVDGLNHTVFNASYSDSYDGNGNLVHSADAQGIQHHWGFDALNRLVSTIDNYNGTDTATKNTTSALAYDALDRLEGVTDPDGLDTIYDHDGLGNRTSAASPDTGTSSDTYDAAGNRLIHTDAKGVFSTSTYDALNRVAGVSYVDSTLNVGYHYDEPDTATGCSSSYPAGRLTRVVEYAVSTVYCYDARGNITRKSQTQGTTTDTTSYSYTLADRLSGQTNPTGAVSTQYSRDADGRISAIALQTSLGSSSAVSAVNYLPFGPISSYTLGNGQTITRTYDANYELTDLVSPALNLHVARDATGNIVALGDVPGASPATETYAYDPLYRLTAVTDGGTALESYSYNKTGDRLSKASPGLDTGVYSYISGTHQLASVGNALRANDANGNTTGSVSGGETFGFGYNDRNRLTLAQRNGQTAGTYTYNAFGQRIAKVATTPQAVTERYAYNEASQLIGEYGTTHRDYVWLGDIPVAVVDATPTEPGVTPLQEGVLVQTSNTTGGSTQFSVQVPAGALGFSMRTLGGTGDVTVYVKFGAPASTTNYDFVSSHTGVNAEAVAITRPKTGTYYMAVVGGPSGYSNVTVLSLYTVNGGTTSTSSPTAINYITADQLGTPRAVSDQSGSVIWQWAYKGNPFGEQQPTSATGYVLNLRYPGQYYDAETNTNYNLFRNFDAPTGRYLQPDPLGQAAGPSLFGYVGSNPLSSVDPLGLCDQDRCKQLSDKINQLRNELAKRYGDLQANELGLPLTGPMSIGGHQQQFENKQTQLRKLLNDFNSQGCNGGLPADAWGYATKDTPSPSNSNVHVPDSSVRNILIGTGLVIGGVIYFLGNAASEVL